MAACNRHSEAPSGSSNTGGTISFTKLQSFSTSLWHRRGYWRAWRYARKKRGAV